MELGILCAPLSHPNPSRRHGPALRPGLWAVGAGKGLEGREDQGIHSQMAPLHSLHHHHHPLHHQRVSWTGCFVQGTRSVQFSLLSVSCNPSPVCQPPGLQVTPWDPGCCTTQVTGSLSAPPTPLELIPFVNKLCSNYLPPGWPSAPSWVPDCCQRPRQVTWGAAGCSKEVGFLPRVWKSLKDFKQRVAKPSKFLSLESIGLDLGLGVPAENPKGPRFPDPRKSLPLLAEGCVCWERRVPWGVLLRCSWD